MTVIFFLPSWPASDRHAALRWKQQTDASLFMFPSFKIPSFCPFVANFKAMCLKIFTCGLTKKSINLVHLGGWGHYLRRAERRPGNHRDAFCKRIQEQETRSRAIIRRQTSVKWKGYRERRAGGTTRRKYKDTASSSSCIQSKQSPAVRNWPAPAVIGCTYY